MAHPSEKITEKMTIQNANVELVFNWESDHGEVVQDNLKKATRFLCLMAFAKNSGFNEILVTLQDRLRHGMSARIAISLDFYQTDANVLRSLHRLSKKLNKENVVLELLTEGENKYSGSTFHPKVYVFDEGNRTTTLVGSANLTSGGLYDNYEVSMLHKEDGHTFYEQIDGYIDVLLESGELAPVTDEIIERYETDAARFKIQQRLAQKRVQFSASTTSSPFSTLQDVLSDMRRRSDSNGFDEQIKVRAEMNVIARRQIENISKIFFSNKEEFLEQYDALINCWHSGGLKRAKPIIAEKYPLFQKALREINGIASLEADEAFKEIKDMLSEVKGAGVNVITELLGTLNNEKFAVMNQNAVHGLKIAGFRNFPPKPLKSNVDGACYGRFCQNASEIIKNIGLKNFAELDTVLNYAYWNEIQDDDIDE